MVLPPRWCVEELERDSGHSTEIFRKERLEEPLEDYLDAFDHYLGNRKAEILLSGFGINTSCQLSAKSPTLQPTLSSVSITTLRQRQKHG